MYDNILPCPDSVLYVALLPEVEVRAIMEQNQTFASDIYNNWVAEASEQAQADPNEDAYAYLFKLRRDQLLEIAGDELTYSWRKRDIAERILYIMGYSFAGAENPEDQIYA